MRRPHIIGYIPFTDTTRLNIRGRTISNFTKHIIVKFWIHLSHTQPIGITMLQRLPSVNDPAVAILKFRYLFRPLSHRKSWHWESSPSLTNHRCQINPRRLLAYAAGFNHTNQNCQYSRTIFCSSAMANAS